MLLIRDRTATIGRRILTAINLKNIFMKTLRSLLAPWLLKEEVELPSVELTETKVEIVPPVAETLEEEVKRVEKCALDKIYDLLMNDQGSWRVTEDSRFTTLEHLQAHCKLGYRFNANGRYVVVIYTPYMHVCGEQKQHFGMAMRNIDQQLYKQRQQTSLQEKKQEILKVFPDCA
jgi:hypothetical protein